MISIFLDFHVHFPDDTYMYDDAIRGAYAGLGGIHHQGHWYDEPPYESDPDDFLMSGTGPAATIQVIEYVIMLNRIFSRFSDILREFETFVES